MTGSEIAQIITSLATFVAAIGALVVSLRNGERAKGIKNDVADIKQQTDGINAQLVKVTGEAEHAKGVKQGEDNPRDADPVKVEIVKLPQMPGA